MNKRTFLRHSAVLSLGVLPLINRLSTVIDNYGHWNAHQLARNEDFWKEIRKGYKLKPQYINLENGYYCFMPEEILEAYLNHIRSVNYEASYYLRTVQFENKSRVAAKLAKVAGCREEELIITRNTTESLDTIIGGYPWKAGDEAVVAEQDYYAMLAMFDQVSRRFGVNVKQVSIPLHPKSDDEIVDLYESAITANTKLLMVCHMISLAGQILPVKKICDMAHRHGVEVLVDGAHAFAHINFRIDALGCDYYGTSLHKWLSAPIGAGFLYVKQGLAGKIWPRFAEDGAAKNDIRRLNHTGTHPVATDLAIENALDYHQRLSIQRKEARLRFLQQYWTQKARSIPGIRINTPADNGRACAIANVGMEGLHPKELAERLFDDYNIWTVAINTAGVSGCRITPNIYTTTEELDQLVDALKKICFSK